MARSAPSFSAADAAQLLAVKGVGPTVVARLEQMGFSNFEQLADADANDVLARGAQLSASSCWKNSPQAKAAVAGAISAAVLILEARRLPQVG